MKWTSSKRKWKTAIFHLNCVSVLLGQDADLEVGGNRPVVLESTQGTFLPDQVVEGHEDSLELGAGRGLGAWHHEQSGKIDPGVLVRLDLEPFPVPVYRLEKVFRVSQ